MNQEQLQIARDVLKLPDLLTRFDRVWSSGQPEYRLRLREALAKQVASKSDWQQALNLDRPPRLQECSVSISHSPLLGGFLLSSQSHIGFDIEQQARISSAVIRRICSEEECAQAPQLNFLWSAKEAAYKSLIAPLQPETTSEIRTSLWQELEGNSYNIWSFSFSVQQVTQNHLSKNLGLGLLFDSFPHFFSICKNTSQLWSSSSDT